MKPTDNKWFTDAQLTALSQGYPPVEFDSEQTITRLALNLLSSRQTIRQLIEAIVSVQELDHCVYYDSALATLKHSNPELAKQIFDEHKPKWDYTEWENVQ